MHYSLFSFVQHSFSMVMNYVNQEPWLPSIGESPSKIFDVTTKPGNITDSQPLSNQEVIKAVTQEFKGKITCSGKWGKLITDWYSIEQATESLILWNMLLIGIHLLIVYYLCKKQLLIKKKMNGSKFQSWKCGVETLCPISALPDSYVKCRAERKPEVSRVHLRSLSPWAVSLAQICPLLEGEGLVGASGHLSVKCLYLRVRWGQSPSSAGQLSAVLAETRSHSSQNVSFTGRLEMGWGKCLSLDKHQHIFAFVENTSLFAWQIVPSV